MVRFVARDLPLTNLHPSAVVSAVAARCAANQNQYWPMYERLFLSHGDVWGGAPERDREVFVGFAGELGLDVSAFVACMDDPAEEQAVLAERDAALSIGVNATPAFFINGRPLRGAQPFQVFEQLVRQEAGR